MPPADAVQAARGRAYDATRSRLAAMRLVQETRGDPRTIDAFQVAGDRENLLWQAYRQAVEDALAREQE
jgi:hypothetical protein